MVLDNFDRVKLPIRYTRVDSFRILYTNRCIFQYISPLLNNCIRHYLKSTHLDLSEENLFLNLRGERFATEFRSP